MRNVSTVALCAAMALFLGCGDKPKDGAAGGPAAKKAAAKKAADTVAKSKVLDLIPAEAPYVFASLEPMPKAFADKILTGLAPLLAKGETALAEELTRLQGKEDEKSKIQAAILGEFKGKLNAKGFESMGFSLSATFAIYGVGVLPVVRWGLKDPKALKDTIARIETKAGKKLPVKKLGNQEYWGLDKDGVTAAVAIIGDELVFTAGPSPAAAKVLPIAFGQQKLAKSQAASGTLAKLQKDNGFKAFGLGYIDLNAIAATVLGKGAGLNGQIWTAMGAPGPGELPPNCEAEIMGLVGIAPRLVVGMDDLSAKQSSARYILEMRSDLATALSGLTAPVPGLGASNPTALLAFGLGIDIPKTLDFAKKKVAEMKAKPYACPLLGDLNQGVQGAEMGLNQPMPPFINGIRGLNVVVKDVTMAGGKPTSGKGIVVLAANDPKSLLATAKQFGGAPLANFNLADDGKAVELPLPLPPEAQKMIGKVFLAMKGNGIAASVGAGEEQNLAAALEAKGASPAPLLSFAYDAQRLVKLTEGTMGEEEKAIVQAMTGLMGVSRTTLAFTKKGLEIQQTTWFK